MTRISTFGTATFKRLLIPSLERSGMGCLKFRVWHISLDFSLLSTFMYMNTGRGEGRGVPAGRQQEGAPTQGVLFAGQ